MAPLYQYECPFVYNLYPDIYDGPYLRADLSNEV